MSVPGEGWIGVREVADFAGVSGSLVRGRWCVDWAKRGLAVKVFNVPLNRHEWRIDPAVLDEVPQTLSLEPAPAPNADGQDEQLDDDFDEDDSDDDDDDYEDDEEGEMPTSSTSVSGNNGGTTMSVTVDAAMNLIVDVRAAGQLSAGQSVRLGLDIQLGRWLGESLLRTAESLESSVYPDAVPRGPLAIETVVQEYLHKLINTGMFASIRSSELRILLTLLAALSEGTVALDHPTQVSISGSEIRKRARIGRSAYFPAVRHLIQLHLLARRTSREGETVYELLPPLRSNLPDSDEPSD